MTPHPPSPCNQERDLNRKPFWAEQLHAFASKEKKREKDEKRKETERETDRERLKKEKKKRHREKN